MNSATTFAPSVLGNQRPRLRFVPEYTKTLGDAAVELVSRSNLVPDQWQHDAIRDLMAVRDDGKWAAPSGAFICPRQNGKSLLAAIREMAGLFLLDERLIVHSSHEQATASEQFRLVLELIETTPEFKKRMLKPIHGKGSEAIELRSGQRILFKTRTSGGLRGFTVDCLVFDEAYNLPNDAIAAMLPTTTAAPNPQVLYASSAVDRQEHDHGVNLARIRRNAPTSTNVAYLEWSAEGDDPERVPPEYAADPRTWEMANPGLGIRQDVETLANIHATMGPRQFAVEHLGIGDWPEDDPDANRVITVAAWQALLDEGSRMASSDGVIAFDVSPDLSWGSIAGAGYTDDGKIHVGIIDREQRFTWMANRIAELYRLLKPSLIICDGMSQARSVLPDLERLNVPVRVTDSKEYAQACSLFAEGVTNKTISHVGDVALLTAIDGADTKPLSDAWKWDRRKSGAADISALVAATLAHWGVATQTKGVLVADLNDYREKIMAELAAERAALENATSPEPVTQPAQPGAVRFVSLKDFYNLPQ